MSWESVITYAGISAMFSAIRTWLSPHKARRLQYFISAMVSIPVGVVVGFLMGDLGFSQGIVFAGVAASALMAENIINIILSFGHKLEKDPVGTIRKVKKLTGK
jgi:uncharacterized membrane protein HdeD (DUF308 family)